MDRFARADDTLEVTDARGAVSSLTAEVPRTVRGGAACVVMIHFFAYHLILAKRRTRVTRAAGFRMVVRPTVFHPRYFLTSEFFAAFIEQLDLSGKRVADVGARDREFSRLRQPGPVPQRSPLST